MSIKNELIRIQVKYQAMTKTGLTPDEFCSLPDFEALEKNGAVIEKIADYHLPEITYLICASQKLCALPWAQQYAEFSNYCLQPEAIDVRAELEQCSKLEEFVEKFLVLQYEPVLKQLSSFFVKMEAEKKRLLERKKSVKLESTQQEKQRKAANPEEGGAIAENERVGQLTSEYQKLTEQIKEYDTWIKKYKKHHERIEEYLANCKDTVLKENREKTYAQLEEIESQRAANYQQDSFIDRRENDKLQGVTVTALPTAELLAELVESGVITDLLRDQLQKTNAAQWLLLELAKPQYHAKAMTILVNLHEDGAINLEQDDYTSFITQNSMLIEEYLCNEYHQHNTTLQAEEKEYLWELAVKLEDNSNGGLLSRFWNQLASRDDWLHLATYWQKFKLNDIYKFMLGLSGKTAELVAKLLVEDEQFSALVKPMEIMYGLLTNDPAKNIHLVYYYLLLQQQQSKELAEEKKLLARELKQQLASQSQELFANIYLPLERTEELAVDLLVSAKRVDSKLVAGKLMENLVQLREKLCDVGVKPLVTPSDWQQQNLLAYDAEKHQFAIPIEVRPKKVRARTMGFSYYDNVKELQQREAFVDSEPQKKQKRTNSKAISVNKTTQTKKTVKSNSQNSDVWYDEVAAKSKTSAGGKHK